MANHDTSAMPHGILPAHIINRYIDEGKICLRKPAADDQIQPASLDLRLGARAYRVQASFLPGPDAKVEKRLTDLALHQFSLTDGAVLETGCVYIVPLMESLDLPAETAAAANPKSSTGRLDVFTRIITDYAQAFDTVAAGYNGPLYAEISPRTFPILVHEGSRLSQIRFRHGAANISDSLIERLHNEQPLVSSGIADIDGGLALSVDLLGISGGDGPVGFRAKRHCGVIDVDKKAMHEVDQFWEPIWHPRELILEPDQFYILASKEAVRVPANYAAEMVPFNPLVGEFRVHYAGFFDPGFGDSSGNGAGSRAVLEVRSHEVPFILEDGQIIGRLVYEPLCERPQQVYGQGIGSNYQRQGLKLSKHFKPFTPANR